MTFGGIPQKLLVLEVCVLGCEANYSMPLLLVLVCIGGDRVDLLIGVSLLGLRGGGRAGVGVVVQGLLDDGVVGNNGLATLCALRGGALEEERSLEDHPDL